jgi:hypothetical protein
MAIPASSQLIVPAIHPLPIRLRLDFVGVTNIEEF